MKRVRVLLIALALAWIFLVTFNYYIVHKPFSVENVLALANVFGDLFVALGLFALAAGLGRRMTRSWVFASSLEAVALRTGLGLGLISFVTFGAGLAGLLNRILFWAAILVAAFLLRDDLRASWRDARAIQFTLASRFERGLALFCGLMLVFALIPALTPPIAWDAQTYHLVIPQTAIAQGRIAPPPNIPYFSFPSLVEMLFLAVMLLKGDIAAQLIHFGFLVLSLALIFAFAQHYLNSLTAILTCAILVAVPSLLAVASWAYVDLALVFYTFAAFAVVVSAREKNDDRWFILAGAFAGFALGIKYTALIIPVALGVLILRARRVRPFILFNAIAALCASPWYLRNWLFTGNPVYPFFLGGKFWDDFRAEWFGRFGTGLANSPMELILAPWQATIFGIEGAQGFSATIGPLLLALMPLLALFVFHRRDEPDPIQFNLVREALLFAGILYLCWLVGVAGSKLLVQTRLLFPAFPMFALVAAFAFDRLRQFDLPQFSLERFTRLLLGLIFGLTALESLLNFAADNRLAYLAGYESRERFLARQLGGYYPAIEFVNRQLAPNARVLFLWEPRAYHAARATQPDSLLDHFAHMRWQFNDAEAIIAHWRAQGFTHVLLNRAGLDYMLQTGYDPVLLDDVRVLEALTTRYLTQVYGKMPLAIVMRDGKPGVSNVSQELYAIYEINSSSR